MTTYTKSDQLAMARIVHDANKAFCESTGDFSQVSWDQADKEARASTIDGVRAILQDPNHTPEASHENWMKTKREQGWTYGTVKDENAKTHPSLVPYEQLSDTQKYKDHLFFSIVKSYMDFVSKK